MLSLGVVSRVSSWGRRASNRLVLWYHARAYGEVAEWSKAHAWKVCNGQPFEGSNPSLTAI